MKFIRAWQSTSTPSHSQTRSQTHIAPMQLIARDFLKMLAAAIALGLAIGIVAAGLALIVASVGEAGDPMPDVGTLHGDSQYRSSEA